MKRAAPLQLAVFIACGAVLAGCAEPPGPPVAGRKPQVLPSRLAHTMPADTPEARQRIITVKGEVIHPLLIIMGNSGVVNLTEAVARAGGPTERASGKVTITRKVMDGSVLEFQRDLVAIMNNSQPSFQLMRGDIIEVGAANLGAGDIPFSKAMAAARAERVRLEEATTVGSLRVQVFGSVYHPGWVELSAGTPKTLVAAVKAAGGPTLRTAIVVTIRRTFPDGETKVFQANLLQAMKGTGPDFELHPGDSILLGEMFGSFVYQ